RIAASASSRAAGGAWTRSPGSVRPPRARRPCPVRRTSSVPPRPVPPPVPRRPRRADDLVVDGDRHGDVNLRAARRSALSELRAGISRADLLGAGAAVRAAPPPTP